MDQLCYLRAVNVGGRNRVPMGELEKLLAQRLDRRVTTFLNSGNIAVQGPIDPAAVRQAVDEVLAGAFDVHTPVIVIEDTDLAAILTKVPFGPDQADSSRQLVYLADSHPDPAGMVRLAALSADHELIWLVDGVFYAWYGAGLGRSKLSTAAIDKALGIVSTGRNTATLTRMLTPRW